MSTKVNDNVKDPAVIENSNVTEDSNANVDLEARQKELLELEKRIDSKMEQLKTLSDEIDSKQKEIEKKLPEITEKALVENSLRVKEQLDKQEKVSIRIPMDEKNPNDKTVPVTISGYTYLIQRGESVQVPKEVERILIEAKYI